MATFNLSTSDLSNNVARASSRVSIVFTNSAVYGNIIEQTIIPPQPQVCDNGFIFSCEDNSQYLPLI